MKPVLHILTLCLAVLPGLVSCQKDPHPSEGTPVKFKAFSRASAVTKTQYAGGAVASGQKERINWVAGDRVSLTSPQADGLKKADYKIASNGTPDNEYSVSTLQNLTEKSNGLQWGTGTHYFYGVYPATASISDNVITATLPKAQTYSGTPAVSTSAGVEHTFIYPDMQLAWMWAGQQVAAGNEVSLYFSPMITTFQLSVTGQEAEEIALTQFQLSSETCALQGNFKATVTVSGPVDRSHLDRMSVAYSEIPARSAGSNDVITFSLPDGIVVSRNKKVTLSVFAYPQGPSGNPAVLDGLSVRFIGPELSRSLKLMDAQQSAWVEFPAGRKINIDGLTLPKQIEPWTFTVEASDLEDEMPDVVVSPVEMIEFETVDGGNLEDFEEVVPVSGSSATGLLVAGLDQAVFSSAGGSGNFYVCSSCYSVVGGESKLTRGGSTTATEPILAWRICGYCEDLANWSATAPSWLSVSRSSGYGSVFNLGTPANADWDVVSFSVQAAASGTERSVLVKFEQYDYSGNVCYLRISQGAQAGTKELDYSVVIGSGNLCQGTGNTVAGTGNVCTGYDNLVIGAGNFIIGDENEMTSHGENNRVFGVGNTLGVWGNAANSCYVTGYYNSVGGYGCSAYGYGNTCIGSYSSAGGRYWETAWETLNLDWNKGEFDKI
ncbi:MAG: hypothetical protein J6M31_01510 [Bacteroidales bacterium]|nr:hypothetical protein [Bacteroidales bacterium]